jgi:hypothetical protein
MAGDKLVQPIDERGHPERSQRAAQRARQPELGEDRHSSPIVARNRAAVAKHEPPAFAARLLGHGFEQGAGLLVGER